MAPEPIFIAPKCRFHLGFSLGGLLLFIANTLWEVGKNPQIRTPPAESVFSIGIFVLGEAAVISFSLAWVFRNLYQSDDVALTRIEEENDDAKTWCWKARLQPLLDDQRTRLVAEMLTAVALGPRVETKMDRTGRQFPDGRL